MAVLAQQMEAQKKAIQATGKTVAQDLERELQGIHPNPVHVRVIWGYAPLLGGGGPREAPERGDPDPGGPPGMSFARGSGGIRDFGLGTDVTLHGREGVFTEAEIDNLLDYGPATTNQVRTNGEGLTITHKGAR
jgi:hypothetical protein